MSIKDGVEKFVDYTQEIAECNRKIRNLRSRRRTFEDRRDVLNRVLRNINNSSDYYSDSNKYLNYCLSNLDDGIKNLSILNSKKDNIYSSREVDTLVNQSVFSSNCIREINNEVGVCNNEISSCNNRIEALKDQISIFNNRHSDGGGGGSW